MQKLSQGDRAAFEHLYDRYFNRLIWFARRFVADVQTAEDLVQEVFLKVIERPELFSVDKRFSTWIYTVTGNLCRNHLRNTQNRDRLNRENLETAVTNSFHHQMDFVTLQGQMNRALGDLSEMEQKLFILRFEEDLIIKQIAERVQIPEGTVKSGLFHLLKKLSRHLKEFTHAGY